MNPGTSRPSGVGVPVFRSQVLAYRVVLPWAPPVNMYWSVYRLSAQFWL